ncbi:MAG: EAL domain-containing protein [Rhodospirillales bacterium]|nr:EAL domain-containing protein [Rhodospirillales bacterium]
MCFRPERAAAAIRRRQGMQAAARALAEDRLEAHYQPIVRLGTRQVIGVEALCRLRTPDGRLLPSGHLAEALRSPSNASLVTDRMLARVARDVRAWLDQGIHLQHVGVNLSQADFRQGDLVARITAALAQYDVPRHLVVLEVTETVELDDGGRTVGTAIERLRNAGLRVALDDFGTGYASLAHLLDIQVDIVKTDKSLMRRFAVGDTGEVLLTALLQMADGLGFQLLAEGVETAAQAIRLEQLGCPLAQGFLFGPPRTAAVTAALLPRAAPAGSH